VTQTRHGAAGVPRMYRHRQLRRHRSSPRADPNMRGLLSSMPRPPRPIRRDLGPPSEPGGGPPGGITHIQSASRYGVAGVDNSATFGFRAAAPPAPTRDRSTSTRLPARWTKGCARGDDRIGLLRPAGAARPFTEGDRIVTNAQVIRPRQKRDDLRAADFDALSVHQHRDPDLCRLKA